MKTLNLDALDTMRHTVEKSGQSYTVKPVTTRIALMIDAASTAEGSAKLTGYVEAIAALLPDMPRADVEDLTVPQIFAIVNLASGQVTAVEEAAADPNVSRPATATASGSTPATT